MIPVVTIRPGAATRPRHAGYCSKADERERPFGV